MRLNSTILAVALIGGALVFLPTAADAQRRGTPRGPSVGQARPAQARPPAGGQAQARPPQPRGGQMRPAPAPGPRYRYPSHIGVYWGNGWGDDFWWSYPRMWYPFGYGPYWYGPYWYGDYYLGYNNSSASLKFDVKPITAEVYVDSRYTGTVDDFDGFLQSLDVDYGIHTVTLWLQGYRTITQEVRLKPGATLKIKNTMVPLAVGEQQDPRPLPAPEAPRLAPRFRDANPPADPDQPEAPGRPLPPQRPDRPPMPPVPVQPGPPAVVGLAQGYGQLVIRAQPLGAQILIDGETWQTSPGTERLIIHLSAGTHQIEVRREGFKTFKAEVQVRNGDVTPINVSLSREDAK